MCGASNGTRQRYKLLAKSLSGIDKFNNVRARPHVLASIRGFSFSSDSSNQFHGESLIGKISEWELKARVRAEPPLRGKDPFDFSSILTMNK